VEVAAPELPASQPKGRRKSSSWHTDEAHQNKADQNEEQFSHFLLDLLRNWVIFILEKYN
jgi:hypothetical protein